MAIIPNGHYTDWSLGRNPIIPNGHYTENRYAQFHYTECSLYRQIFQTLISFGVMGMVFGLMGINVIINVSLEWMNLCPFLLLKYNFVALSDE